MWVEVTSSFFRMMENGKVKKVSEKLLCDAMSVSEAEAVATKEYEGVASEGSDFKVKATKITKISEIFNVDNEVGKYYLVKVAFITIDEKTAAEKRSISQILVGAENFRAALDNFNEGMKGTMADYEIVSIAETTIVSVCPHTA